MKVENMTSSQGNKVTNQFVVHSIEHNPNGDDVPIETFQSYDTVIAQKRFGKVSLDAMMWDCSVTTGKYRNQFLGETKTETQKKIDSGEYILTDLN